MHCICYQVFRCLGVHSRLIFSLDIPQVSSSVQFRMILRDFYSENVVSRLLWNPFKINSSHVNWVEDHLPSRDKQIVAFNNFEIGPTQTYKNLKITCIHLGSVWSELAGWICRIDEERTCDRRSQSLRFISERDDGYRSVIGVDIVGPTLPPLGPGPASRRPPLTTLCPADHLNAPFATFFFFFHPLVSAHSLSAHAVLHSVPISRRANCGDGR